MNSLIVIPARLASTRLPEKLLLDRTGKPLLQHTYEAAAKSKKASGLVVACDDSRIAESVKSFGGRVVMTREDHPSGTDRLAEVAQQHSDVDLFVNVQGDEPEIDAADIDAVLDGLQGDPDAQMATLATPLTELAALLDPACVKVVFDAKHYAMYFSRSPIPFCRSGWEDGLSLVPPIFFQHIGLYAYRRDFLLQLAELSRSECEQVESLEQLRALHAGAKIRVLVTPRRSVGIDTPADYEAFVSRQLS